MSLLKFIKKWTQKKSLKKWPWTKLLTDSKKNKQKSGPVSQKKLESKYLNQIPVNYTRVFPSKVKLEERLFYQYLSITKPNDVNRMGYVDFINYLRSKVFDTRSWKKSNDKEKKGILSESVVRIVLMVLRSQNYINDFMMTRTYSLLDMRGVDTEIVYVTDAGYRHMPLQIKSSLVGQQNHITEYGNSIPSVIINNVLDFPEIMRKIKYIIHSYKEYSLVEHV